MGGGEWGGGVVGAGDGGGGWGLGQEELEAGGEETVGEEELRRSWERERGGGRWEVRWDWAVVEGKGRGGGGDEEGGAGWRESVQKTYRVKPCCMCWRRCEKGCRGKRSVIANPPLLLNMSRSGEFFIFAPSTIESALGRKTRGKRYRGRGENLYICRGDMVMRNISTVWQPHAPWSKMCVKKRVFLCNGGGSSV